MMLIQMKKNLLQHLKYYAALLIMQVAGFFLLLSSSGNKEFQIAAIIISGVGYAVWAILHQYLEHSLTTKIVVEYVLFGTFGIVASLLFFK